MGDKTLDEKTAEAVEQAMDMLHAATAKVDEILGSLGFGGVWSCGDRGCDYSYRDDDGNPVPDKIMDWAWERAVREVGEG